MNFAQVTGTIVCTKKLPCFDGEKFLLLALMDEKLKSSGKEVVATDITSAGPGEYVFYETGREAAIALENTFNVSDATVMAIIDDINDEKPGGKYPKTKSGKFEMMVEVDSTNNKKGRKDH